MDMGLILAVEKLQDFLGVTVGMFWEYDYFWVLMQMFYMFLFK